jgi:hypothetical protein
LAGGEVNNQSHGRMARGGHELPNVSPGPVIPDPFTPCGWATPEMALQPFQGRPTHRMGGLRPFSTFLDTPRRMLWLLVARVWEGEGAMNNQSQIMGGQWHHDAPTQ